MAEAMRQKLHHIEKVAWVLTILGSHQFAGIHVFQRYNRDFEIGHQYLSGDRSE